MAQEANVRISLQVRGAAVLGATQQAQLYQSQPTGFTANVSRIKYIPGDIDVPDTGVLLDLSQLIQPGLVWWQNLDPTNFVTVGPYDGSRFYPFMEMLPGEMQQFRFSRWLNQEFLGTGTGTNADKNKVLMIATGGTCIVRAHIFDN
jgi:hypothetical protein